MKEMEGKMRKWEYLPNNAFLYLPQGEDVKSGEKEKAWRKIFENGDAYDEFEESNITLLEKKLEKKNLNVDPWFTKANKLRFLQANKFKIAETYKSIQQANRWRQNDFPVTITDHLRERLKSGCFYFCGRDQCYRPILVADIAKFVENDEKIIPDMLMVILEFMLDELLIEGQVENYVLVIDLEAAGLGMKNTVMKIVDFTSNTYRGRLYASYLLGMPSFLNFVWNSIASSLVSENTLRKIKISKKMRHDDMWLHIDRQVIEEKYGGIKKNMTQFSWPPKKGLLTIESKNSNLIAIQQYNNRFYLGKLKDRKILQSLIKAKQQKLQMKEDNINSEDFDEFRKMQKISSVQEPTNKVQTYEESKINIESIGGTFQDIGNHPDKEKQKLVFDEKKHVNIKQNYLTQAMVRKESLPKIRERNFDLFFEDIEFLIAIGLLDESQRTIEGKCSEKSEQKVE